ncbi:MAG TPA: hypothetical protein VNV66_20045, partial [Pilimelia sp.]|nr:hypothetical protein [Pilimelia sp.]
GPGAAAPGPATPGPATPPAAGGPRTADLVRLGMPADLAAAATADDPYQATLQALAHVPAPPAPPAEPGDVLVIAGELAEALPLARQLATDLHLDPTKLLLVAPSAAQTGLHASRRISGPADARRRSRTLHRADVPHLVVIDAPVRGGREGWVADLADALGATAVWAVVDASRKTADTARHLATLGPVDAVAVYGVESTGDPASVLALDTPVALLDGRPATARAWAGLLGERLQPQPPASGRAGRGRRAGGR